MLKIKKIREKMKLSQKDVASALNIGISTLSQYETGKREPDTTTLIKLAKYFDVSVDYLLGIAEEPIHLQSSSLETVNISDLSDESKKDLREYKEFLKIRDNKNKDAEISKALTERA